MTPKNSRNIPVVRNVLEANARSAEQLRALFREKGILVLNLISSPGSGKTSFLERTLRELKDELRMAVIEGDPQTINDAERVSSAGADAVVQINTEGGCHLNAAMTAEALSRIDLENLDVIFIENVGNLVCPAEFDLGEDMKVNLLSVTEGDDKPEKYPLIFSLSKVVILNKTDLLPYVDFDIEKASALSRSLNPDQINFRLSCRTGEGFTAWLDFLKSTAAAKKAAAS